MIRAFLGLFLLLTAGSCTAISNAVNAPPLQRFTAQLIAKLDVKLTVVRCEMYEDTRAGSCTVAGPASEIEAFVDRLALPLEAPERDFRDTSCLPLADLADPSGKAFITRPDVRKFAPAERLKPNRDNVRMTAVYAGPAWARIELEYPFG